MALSLIIPLVDFADPSGSYVALDGLGFWYKGEYLLQTWGILTIGILSAVLAFITIFLFKNRKRQIMLCKINIFLIVLYYVTMGVYANAGIEKFGLIYDSIQFGLALPLIAIILNVLALSKIKKDEKLVRSLDRIR